MHCSCCSTALFASNSYNLVCACSKHLVIINQILITVYLCIYFLLFLKISVSQTIVEMNEATADSSFTLKKHLSNGAEKQYTCTQRASVEQWTWHSLARKTLTFLTICWRGQSIHTSSTGERYFESNKDACRWGEQATGKSSIADGRTDR